MRRPTLGTLVLLLGLGVESAAAQQPQVAAARALALRSVGRYQEAERELRGFLEQHPDAPPLWVLLGDVLMERGKVVEAEESYRRVPGSLYARLRLAELKERRGDRAAALLEYRTFVAAYNGGAKLSSTDLAAVARAVRHLGAEDPQLYKDALRAYDEAIAADSANLDARVELGDLFLDRYNETEARATFEGVLKVNPNHPGALLGLARATRFEGSEEPILYVRKSLESNPDYLPARLFLARLELEQEAYDGAAEDLKRALAVNPSSLEALSLLAAARLLAGDRRGFEDIKAQALAINPAFADLYVTVGDLVARNRRYDEGAAFARQAVTLDPKDWPAYALLGINQMRLGDLASARKNLEAAFSGDPYDVWTKNTLDLLDHLDRYRTIETPRFRVVVAPREAELLALYAVPLAEEAFDSLAARYGYRPTVPIRIELYDRHADFSVRTVGLVGLGALGVSFGPVVAMDSPSAREPGHFHWGSTLWHEVAHSFQLGLSASRVPRWFTEGLAVFEERRARPGWGDNVTPGFLLAFSQNRLMPVSQLNRGFTNPDYPEQLAYSYYQASLVCELIVQEKGLGALRTLLEQLGQGRSTTLALTAVTGLDLAALDQRFDAYVRQQFAQPLAALRSRSESGPRPGENPDDLIRRAEQATDDFAAQLAAGQTLFAQGKALHAEPYFERAKRLFPQYAGLDSPAWYLAQIHRSRGDRQRAAHELQLLTAANAGHYPALLALATLRDSLGDKERAARALESAVYVYPFEPWVHARLAELASDLKRWPVAIRERRAVLALAPVDRAEALYQLALAYYDAGQLRDARGAVLQALEQAPNFERAQGLLLKIREGRP